VLCSEARFDRRLAVSFRKALSAGSELGFARRNRNIGIQRNGFVAFEHTKKEAHAPQSGAVGRLLADAALAVRDGRGGTGLRPNELDAKARAGLIWSSPGSPLDADVSSRRPSSFPRRRRGR